MSSVVKPYEGYVYKPGTLNVEDLKMNYLFGIDLSGPEGDAFPDTMIENYMNMAVNQVETLFDIKVFPAELEEDHDYFVDDYRGWGFMQLRKKPVIEVTSMKLMYGDMPAITIPPEWIRLQKRPGQINLFPTAGSAGGLIVTSSGIHLGMNSYFDYAPGAWKIKYVAGMGYKDPETGEWVQQIDGDLLHYIYCLGTIATMTVWGDLIIGAGIASQSISLDGISQSIGTTQSAMFGGASGRIESMRKDLELLMPILMKRYNAIPMVVI